MLFVVDTGVPCVANGKDSPPPACVNACVKKLDEVRKAGTVALDDGWRIIREYLNNLHSSGQPGAGDGFLKWILVNRENPSRCCWVRITPKAGDPEDFEAFPASPDLSGFDRSDRKFVAVSLTHPERPSILAALDTDWWFYRKPLEDAGVKVRFVCPQEIADYAGRKKPSGKR